MSTTRAEHLAWCKKRALEYCDKNEVHQAWASFTSDLRKHPDTDNYYAFFLGTDLLFSKHLTTPDAMRKFIEEFD